MADNNTQSDDAQALTGMANDAESNTNTLGQGRDAGGTGTSGMSGGSGSTAGRRESASETIQSLDAPQSGNAAGTVVGSVVDAASGNRVASGDAAGGVYTSSSAGDYSDGATIGNTTGNDDPISNRDLTDSSTIHGNATNTPGHGTSSTDQPAFIAGVGGTGTGHEAAGNAGSVNNAGTTSADILQGGGQGTGSASGSNGYTNAAGAATDVSGGVSGGTSDGTVTGGDMTSGDMTGFGTTGGGSAGSADVPAAPNPDAMPE